MEMFLEENSDLPLDTLYSPKGFFASSQGELIFSLGQNKIYGPYVVGDYFKISKLIDKKNNGNVRASHILISYQGARESNPQITRTKEEARREAEKK